MKQMKRRTWMTAALLCCDIGIALAADIKTDYDHAANFAQYKTYSWIKVQAEDPLWNDRIQQDVDEQLSAKGWTKVDSGGEASVAAYGSVHKEKSLQTWYDGFGGGWRWGGFGREGMATTTTQVTPVGSLMVDIYDSSNKQLLWRGSVSGDLSKNSDKNTKKLAGDVKDLFKKFPPEAKG